jgi:hypothetical protein
MATSSFVRRSALAAPIVLVVFAACAPVSSSGSSSGGGGGSAGSSGGAGGAGGAGAGDGIPGNDTSVCTTYGDDQPNLSRCGVRGGGLDCGGAGYSCTGICGQGPVCFARASCCSDTCSAFGSMTVCGTKGHLNDSDRTVADCDKGFAARHSGPCDTANPDFTCCTSGAPSFLCSPGSHCASLEGGGYCCTSAIECLPKDTAACGAGRPCCSGLTCRSGYCRSADFDKQCIQGGKTCVQGETNCCEGLVCRNFASNGGSGSLCAPPDPGGGQQN